VAKLRPIEKVVDKIQPGPIRCLYGPSPLIQPIYIFFPANFGELHGPSPTIRPFYFLGQGLFVPAVLVFFFYKMDPLVKQVPLVRF